MDSVDAGRKLNSRDFHKYAFWLYSVIVGLSVEEALRHVLPHIGELFTMDRPQRIEFTLEIVRLALFVQLAVRFYLGSVRYFFDAHISDEAPTKYKRRDYTIDFFFGVLHFSSFLALSFSIDAKQPPWLFLGWLIFILLYDIIWWLICYKLDTVKLVTYWAIMNFVVCALGIGLYFLATLLCSYMDWAEWGVTLPQIAFMVPVIIFNFIDIREVFFEQSPFRNWLLKKIGKD